MVSTLNSLLPFVSSLITLIFALVVFRHFLERRRAQSLLWGIGLVMYALGGAAEAYYAALGWNDLVFRLWYLFGAILVAAWLGQGTVYLLLRRRIAHGLMAILILGSLYATFKIFTANLDPSLLPGTQLSGHAITSGGVRTLTPFFNIYGLVTLVGGALYSAWVFGRRRILFNRMLGCVLLALGALAPSLGGTLSRLGLTEYLYLGELLGAVIMFAGFLLTTRPEQAETRVAPATAP